MEASAMRPPKGTPPRSDARRWRAQANDALEEAVRQLLRAMGEDPERPGLHETPRRVAAMYRDLTGGRGRDAGEPLAVAFEEPYVGVVLVREIPFYSLCEHHLLPFFGHASVAYQPGQGAVTGLSKLARVVGIASRRLQLQERMTREIADALEEHLQPQGVLVRLQAEHLCMAMRGVERAGAATITLETRGSLAVGTALYQATMESLR